ncbi:MAG: response regulator transcription factor [Chlorobi bacterium]|nr:response regulator transcription factor [Chlorobiota bacterium]
MRIFIIEDEIPSQRMLADLILKLRPGWEIAGFAGSVADTVEWLKNNDQPDVIFSDIQLTDGTCFEIFEQVNVLSSVIFTTAYDEYAIQAFRVNSVDYLLKPISEKDLLRAIEKLEAVTSDKQMEMPDMKLLMDTMLKGKMTWRSRILVSVPDGFIKINVEDVAFFQSSQKVTTAFTFDRKNYVIDFTLDKLHEQLDPDMFFRANRQFILNINSITKVENWFNGKLIVKTQPMSEEKIIVSRDRARQFKEWIDK